MHQETPRCLSQNMRILWQANQVLFQKKFDYTAAKGGGGYTNNAYAYAEEESDDDDMGFDLFD